MKELIKDFLVRKQELIEQLKKYVVNKDIPLDERWELFITSGLGSHQSWLEEFEGVSEDSYFDTYYYEKYQTIYSHKLFETAVYKKVLDSEEKQNTFREDVLEKFVYSFKFDW